MSEPRAIEEELRASELRYRAFFEDDVAANFITDVAGRIVDCNRSFVRMFGHESVETAIGSTVIPLYSRAEDRLALIERVRKEGRVESIELELKRLDGGHVHAVGNIIGVNDAAGRLTLMRGHLFDETRRKALETELRHSQKMEAIGLLAGGVAHDFNNVLTAILGYSQLALNALPADATNRAEIEEIRGAAERAASLTRQLLAFSRNQVLQPQPLDLNMAVAAMARMLGRLLAGNIRVVTSFGPELRPVLADPGQLEQVIMNLAVNARDAMPEGGVLTLETSNADGVPDGTSASPGRWVRLRVTDTGIGMDDKTRARIFEPFFTTKDRGRGTGLGLSTVYGVVKQSEGHVTVTSTPAGGTTFEVWLPARGEPGRLREPVEAPAHAGGGGECVLLVEDDPAVRDLGRRMLERMGYRVAAVPHAEDARRQLESGLVRADLVFSDVILPGMNGATLAQWIVERFPGLPVVLTSGYTEQTPQIVRLLQHGCRFLQKPYTPEQVGREIRSSLDRTKAARDRR